jgi:hypothetical protein
VHVAEPSGFCGNGHGSQEHGRGCEKGNGRHEHRHGRRQGHGRGHDHTC